MKTRIRARAQRESSGEQLPTTEGDAGRAAGPPSSELSDSECVAARREEGDPAKAGKYSSS